MRWNLMRLVVVILVVVSLGAQPAAANVDHAAVGAVAGDMHIGKWFNTAIDDGCTKDGVGFPAGRGLYYPLTPSVFGVLNGDDLRERHATWFMDLGGAAFARIPAGMGSFSTTLVVCGWMDRAPGTSTPLDPPNRYRGIGAACGVGKGFGGRGNLQIGPQGYNVTEMGWKATVGAILPVIARTQQRVGVVKTAKFGTLVALVGVGPSLACLGLKILPGFFNNGNGAQEFPVAAAIFHTHTTSLTPNFFTDPVMPKGPHPVFGDNTKQCKGGGPAPSFGPTGKKTKESTVVSCP